MLPGRSASPLGASQDKTIKDLLSYRIHRLANTLSQGAARRYKAEFDVSLMEWRMLALLGDFAPMTLKQLALESGLDKSLASRAISGLVERRLVLRTPGTDDAREVSLRLSASGRRVYEGLMQSARARDAAFHAALSPAELATLDSLLEKLMRVARQQAQPEAWDTGQDKPRSGPVRAIKVAPEVE